MLESELIQKGHYMSWKALSWIDLWSPFFLRNKSNLDSHNLFKC